MDKSKKRKLRKAELENLELSQLRDVAPYKTGQVTAAKSDPSNPTVPSKAEMIETILAHEGLISK